MSYRVIFHRYGSKQEEEETKTLEECNRFFDQIENSGEGFPEYIVDKNNIILRDGKENVIGLKCVSEVGEVYED